MMMTTPEKPRFLLFLLAILPSLLLAAGSTAYIYEIPDFTQSRITGSQHGHGSEYCAPVAVSNSLMWMTNFSGEQADLVKLLASGRYMNTDIWKGTTTSNLLRGVDAIARDLFGGYRSLEYQGWKNHPVQFSTGTKVPDIYWITDGIGKDSTVWLNVGWYQYDWQNDIYHRVGGHWVTLVGYDTGLLIIHDPAPRAGRSFANEYVYTSMLGSGILAGRLSGLPRQARGYLLLGKGMHLKDIADLAIVDGAVRFRK
jgi:hypothetical protein